MLACLAQFESSSTMSHYCTRCGTALDNLTGWYVVAGGEVCGACRDEATLAQTRGQE